VNTKNFTSLKGMRKYLKQRTELKKVLYPVRLTILVFLILLGFAWSHVNFYFYIFIFTKILIVFGVCLFTIYAITDEKEVLEFWKTAEKRRKVVRTKMIYSTIETLTLFSICLFVFFILWVSGAIRYWDEKYGGGENPLVSLYQPDVWEILTIGAVFVLTLLAVWTSMYWFSGCFLKIKGYDEERKIIKIKLSKFLICISILVVVFWIIFGGIDLIYIRIKIGGSFEGIQALKNLLEPYVDWIPIVEIPVLVLFNIFFFLSGMKGLRHNN